MRIMTTKISVLVLALLASVQVSGAPELKGSPAELRGFLKDPANSVRINGYADDTAYADIARITLIITTENKLLAEAIEVNSALRTQTMKEFLGAGVAAEKINTSKFSTSPQFGWFGDKPKSYKVVNRMQVEVSDEKHMRAVALAADNNPEIEFSDIEFEYSGDEEMKKSVLAAAVDDLMEKKSYYEERLGLVLKPVKFTAPNVSAEARGRVRAAIPQSVRAVGLEEITVTSRRNSEADYLDEGFTMMTFDEMDYDAYVTVTFEVSQPN
jgi:uncharacterized protein YggE